MFEQFTDRARLIVDRARQETQRLKSGAVGAEHILLALVNQADHSDPGVVILRQLGVDPAVVARNVEKALADRTEMTVDGTPPFAPSAQRVIDDAREQGRASGYVGTEHLVLALLGERDGVAITAVRSAAIESGAAVVATSQSQERPVFERFTDRARNILTLAKNEAQRCKHDSIDTEHILLALVKEGSGVGANLLKNLGLELAVIEREVEKALGDRPHTHPSDNPAPTVPAKRVLELAREQGRALGHNYVGSEHLVLGLLSERDGVAATVLTKLGVTCEAARDELVRLLSQG